MLQLSISVHQLFVFIQGDLHLTLSALQSVSQLLNDLVCFFELVVVFLALGVDLALNVALFKLKAINAHLCLDEFLLQPVVLHVGIFVFLPEFSQLRVYLLQLSDLALLLGDLSFQTYVNSS